METKICSKCKIEKPISEFTGDSEGRFGKKSSCRKCRNILQNNWYGKNRKKLIPERRNYNLKKKYGIDLKFYNYLFKQQQSKCAICGTDNPGWREMFSVDHNHLTGEIRGLLCNNCNAGLGYFQENIIFLQSAINYIKPKKENRNGIPE
jgi:hypothetical protein